MNKLTRKNTNTRESRTKWDKDNLSQHLFKVNKNSELDKKIRQYKKDHPGEFSSLIKKLLEEYFKIK